MNPRTKLSALEALSTLIYLSGVSDIFSSHKYRLRMTLKEKTDDEFLLSHPDPRDFQAVLNSMLIFKSSLKVKNGKISLIMDVRDMYAKF